MIYVCGHQIVLTEQNFDYLYVNKSETYELNFIQNTHDLEN